MRKLIIYSSALLLMLFVPFLRYYVSTPWVNACVLDYVDNLDKSYYEWNIYNINGANHIEPKNSSLVLSLEQYKVGEANWCIMKSGRFFTDATNTIYCVTTYWIRKSPIHDKLKEPLSLLKRE